MNSFFEAFWIFFLYEYGVFWLNLGPLSFQVIHYNLFALQKGLENVKVGKMVSLHHMGLPKQYLEEVPTKNIFCPNFREGGGGLRKKFRPNFLLYQLGGGGEGSSQFGTMSQNMVFFILKASLRVRKPNDFCPYKNVLSWKRILHE